MISLTEADILDNIIKWNATELEPEIITENVKGENTTKLENNIYHIIEDIKVPSVNCNTLNISDNCEINTYDTIEISVVIVLFLLIVVTVIGNTLIISAVVTTKRLRTVTNCFVTSLAAADLMVGIFVMPPAIAVHISGKFLENSYFYYLTFNLRVSVDVYTGCETPLAMGQGSKLFYCNSITHYFHQAF